MKPFAGIRSGPISLYLIDTWNVREAVAMVCKFTDRKEFYDEMMRSYLPTFDAKGRRTKWGFYARLNGEIAGLSLLGVNSKSVKLGYTGADTLAHMRGKGVAPGSKPMLFHLGFELLKMTRIETGCHVSNKASQRSIEKTLGFKFTGVVSPGTHPNSRGEMEDERMYEISREDWKRLYAGIPIEVF
jgi:RimJ/RimL family protein N-acetyltransferase